MDRQACKNEIAIRYRSSRVIIRESRGVRDK